MKIEVGYGNSVQTCEFPDENLAGIVLPNEVEHRTDEQGILQDALQNPIGARPLAEYDLSGKKIVILTSDETRPMPTYKVMPVLLDTLYAAGADPSNIRLVFACGSHRSLSDEEKQRLAGERAWKEVVCEDSTEYDFVHVGDTAHGTPVDIAEHVLHADFRIALGNIEYHYFAGYSGGAKALFPGCSTYEAIQVNHAMMVQEDAHAGKLIGNPLRADLEEGAAMVGIDYLLNVVLDEHKNIIYAVAGDWVEAHRNGCAFLDKFYWIELHEKADIVITSQGGAPKDLNLYQTQKALDNAKHVVKDGGIIILVGACSEGIGNKKFEAWMADATCPHDLVERVQTSFELGGHKAAAIGMVMEKADVYLVSTMDKELVESMFFTGFHELQQAVDAAIETRRDHAKILVMPYGGSTLPIVKERN